MRQIRIGDQGTEVYYVQLALQRAGYNLKLDGVMGEETCMALRSFLGEEECVVGDMQWERLLPYLRGFTDHRIKDGDTIWKLANEYGTTVGAIRIANPRLQGRNLPIGDLVRIPFLFELVSDEVPYSSFLTECIIEGLHVRYPYVRRENAGYSVLGKPLSVLRIGMGEKQVFYSASYHANEWINTPVLLRFVEDYAKKLVSGEMFYGVNPGNLFFQYELFVLPLVNPDGVDLVTGTLDNGRAINETQQIAANYPQIPYPNGWKANIEGVDLNLQFPAGWELAKQIKEAAGFVGPAPRDYVGEAPLTAPESLAVYTYTAQHNFSLILAYHTQGEVIYWKYLNYEPIDSRRIALYFGKVSGYAVELTPTESGYAGYKDWFIEQYDRPGYTIETGMGVSPLPISQFPNIYRDNIQILIGGMTQLTE